MSSDQARNDDNLAKLHPSQLNEGKPELTDALQTNTSYEAQQPSSETTTSATTTESHAPREDRVHRGKMPGHRRPPKNLNPEAEASQVQ